MDKKHSDKGNSINIPKKNSKTETAKNETKNFIESPAKMEKTSIEENKKPKILVTAPSNNVNIEKTKVLVNEPINKPDPKQNIMMDERKKYEPAKLQKKAVENKLSEIKSIFVNHFEI